MLSLVMHTFSAVVSALLLVSTVASVRAEEKPASPVDAKLAAYLTKHHLVVRCGSDACSTAADFDSDGTSDRAVLVAEANGKQRTGIVVQTAQGIVQFGAGARSPWKTIGDDGASHRSKSPADLQAPSFVRVYVWPGGRLPKAANAITGQAVELGYESARALFFDGKAWNWMVLGF